MTRMYIAMEDSLVVIDHQRNQTELKVKLQGLPTYAIAVDPHHSQRVYCSTFGEGLWRSDDAGETWQQAGDGILYKEVMSVAVSPVERNGKYGVVWAGTEPSALFRSEDGGETWQERTSLQALPSKPIWSFPPRPYTHHVRWIEPDPLVAERLFVAIEQGGIMRSVDAGETWEDHKQGAQFDGHTLATHKLAPGRVYEAAGGFHPVKEIDEQGREYIILTEGGYSETGDGGVTWEPQLAGLDQRNHHYLWGVAVDPADPNTIIVSAARGPQQAHFPPLAESFLYRCTKGSAWQLIQKGLPEPEGTNIYALASNEAEPGVFYAATGRGLYRSADAGLTWQGLDVTWPERYRWQRVFGFIVKGEA